MRKPRLQRTPRVTARTLLAAVLLAALAACSNQDYDPTADWSKERLYDEARRAMENAEFQQAIDYFETLEARYPFGPLALQAQLDIAYSYYEFGQYDAAIAAADRFIKLHPTHEGAAYAHYLRGLIRFNRDQGLLARFFPREMSQMDQERLRKAFSDFRVVVTQHGDSRYASDARKRMTYLRNQMAEHEYEVARFYFDRSAFTATVNRVDYLLAHYDGAPIVPDALELQARAYGRLGLEERAADTRRVLAASYPGRAGESTAAGGDAPGFGVASEASTTEPGSPGKGGMQRPRRSAATPPSL